MAENRKQELLEACMQVIAEDGLSAFSMKKVTMRVGVSEALVYRHFATKDKLLNACYDTVHRQIAALYDEFPHSIPETREEMYELIYRLWMTYMAFLVKNNYRTIFYFEYRDSAYLRGIRNQATADQHTYFKSFHNIYIGFEKRFHIKEQTSADHLWTYILDTAGIFAKRIIRGELPDTQESYENTWRLIFGGIEGLLWKER